MTTRKLLVLWALVLALAVSACADEGQNVGSDGPSDDSNGATYN